KLGNDGHYVEGRRVAQARSYRQIAEAFRIAADIDRFDVVITNEYFCAFGLCLRSLVSRAQAKVAVIGFNVSRRYLSTRFRPLNLAINRVFQQLSLIVVHSHAERHIFSKAHDLRKELFEVVPWGFDIPKSFQARTVRWRSPFDDDRFVSMVGRNNRDFETLRQALAGTGVPAVFVTSTVTPDIEASELMRVFYDLPFDECLDVMQQSAVVVTLLKDDRRGAGHITVVSAMHLGKPQVFSSARVLRDYVQDGEHGIAVPIGDAVRVRMAVLDLLSNRDKSEYYAARAREFAVARLSNEVFQEQILKAIYKVLH
ncbi:MAG TPA: glycosyltransferase, partial [Chitinophagaceae bacterium]